MKKYSSTKAASLRQTSRNERLKVTLWVALVMVVLLLLLPRLVSFAASVVLMPVVAVEDWFRDSDAVVAVYLREKSEILEDMQQLEQQLAELDLTDYSADVLKAENNQLRSLLGNATSSDRIGVGIVGRPTELPYDVLVIDKGSQDGIKEHTPVFVGQNQVVGFVARVHPYSSVVALATTPGLASTVYIYGPNIYTTAEGIGGGLLRVNVPQGIELSEGNLVVIPSFGSGVYGTVSLVESVPTKPEQYGYVTIEIPISSLRYASVGRDPLQPISFETAKEVVSSIRTDLSLIDVPDGVLVDVPTASSSDDVTTTSEESI